MLFDFNTKKLKSQEEMKKETKKHRLLLAAYQGGGGAECMSCTYLVAQLPVATAVR